MQRSENANNTTRKRSTYEIRRYPNATSVPVKYPGLIENEANGVDFLMAVMHLKPSTFADMVSGPDFNPLEVIFHFARLEVIKFSFGLDTKRLSINAQRVLYLFAVGRTNLLRVVDENGNPTNDGLAYVELDVLLYELPDQLIAMREHNRYEAAEEYFGRLLGLVAMPDDWRLGPDQTSAIGTNTYEFPPEQAMDS